MQPMRLVLLQVAESVTIPKFRATKIKNGIFKTQRRTDENKKETNKKPKE